ncbi:MAG: choice-of-anchor B family protein [Chitinophagales bacterium]|nr:choice-of-anchor B family protein [Chitinophagales bacterium]
MKIKSIQTLLFVLFSSMLVAQTNVTLLGRKTYPGKECSALWGYTAQDGREYALEGVADYLSIVDITNPSSPLEVAQVPCSNSIWHEIKTYSHYAYMVSDQTSDGVIIVDLQNLPNSVTYTSWHGEGTPGLSVTRAHTLWIDTLEGILYLNGGSKILNGVNYSGTTFHDIKTNPLQPAWLGAYNDRYVHDAYVRDNFIYTAEVYDGYCSIVDISDKANPVKITDFKTPSQFTHNTWLSDDSKYLYTTDEVGGSRIGVYDISDLSDVRYVGFFKSTATNPAIIHNVHVKDDFLVMSYYRDGVVIGDAREPEAIINMGNYDTSPQTGDGFNGCWEVYPYFPSGNMIASDIELGLFVLKPTYIRGSHLKGIVYDSITKDPILNASVKLVGGGLNDNTDISGKYIIGRKVEGNINVEISKSGYTTQTINNVPFTRGVTTELNIGLLKVGTAVTYNNIYDVSLINNPVASALYLSIPKNFTGYLHYELTDISGKSVGAGIIQQSGTAQISETAALSSGLYFISIKNNTQAIFLGKFVKQ